MIKSIEPAQAGMDALRLSRLAEAIERDLDQALYDGCVVIAARRSGIVFHQAFGWADRDSGRKMEKGALFHTMSSGKQFVSALALNRVERGDLRLTMQVRELIREYGVKGKESTTLLHLLTQTAGLINDVPPGLSDAQLGDLAQTIKVICDSAAVDIPGQRVVYSAYAASAVVAELVRRSTSADARWRDIVREDLFEPLGMRESAAGLPASRRDRVCPIRARGRAIREEAKRLDQFITEDTEIPGGTYTTTAEDLIRFAMMLLNDGALLATRLLSPAMLDLASRDHTGSDPVRFRSDIAMGKWPPVYGLGFMVRGPGIYPMAFGTLASPTALGGMGHGSTVFWADRERDLCLAFLSTGLIDDYRHIERCQRYSDIVHGAVTGP